SGALKDRERVVLARRLGRDLVQRLIAGQPVVLLADQDALTRPAKLTFWPQWIRGTGTFVENHPALTGFPHDGFCAYQFIRLFGRDVKTLNLSERGSVEREKLAPVVWGLSQDNDPDMDTQWHSSGNRWKIYRHGLICEGRVGEGRLLVCCLDVLGGIQQRHPEASYLLDCLINYARSPQAAPTTPTMTVQDLRQVFVVE
ncbi:MAG: hypothetical protein ACC628_23230, partial [Pirellulaceae bacterium]